MEEEIVSLNEPVYEHEGKTWLNVAITIQGLSQINKIILGDEPDENSNQEKIRKQMHKDCLRLFKEFKK
ncbi:MAG TPA: hypothetical protein VL854_01920 [Nitrososphaeraceae archaeon]|nr:hypothetical protein [Nitrososphaeraceae archaeon]